MNDKKLRELREKYSRMSDEELKELLAAGKDEFEAEAFTLLAEEAEKRRIALTEVIASAEQGAEPAETVRRDVDVENYTDIASINDPGEKEAIQKILDAKNIGHFFQPISFSGQPLPVMLAVEITQAQDALDALADFQPKNTILFR
jgi:hypothetical protein